MSQTLNCTLIDSSTHESGIFGVPIGRVCLEKDFVDWNALREEISTSDYQYIRLRVKDPGHLALDHIQKIAKRAHLLEILRFYTTRPLNVTKLENVHSEFSYVTVDKSNRDLFFETFISTYEDIP